MKFLTRTNGPEPLSSPNTLIGVGMLVFLVHVLVIGILMAKVGLMNST